MSVQTAHRSVQRYVLLMADGSQFQPLFPEERVLGPLQDLAAELIAECHRSAGQALQPVARALAPKLRVMNAYYTNKIEGQHAKPADIERALRKDFDADVAMAKKQRLALVHMEVEEQLERTLEAPDARAAFSGLFVREIHRLLYEKLPEGDRVTDEGEHIVPGEYRTKNVTAGRHVAPPWQDVMALMQGWADRYEKLAGAEQLVIGAACAHHRLVWVHPFVDGNGRPLACTHISSSIRWV